MVRSKGDETCLDNRENTCTGTSWWSYRLFPFPGYLNVLVNSQWRTCWCLIKNGQLWFYQDKGKNKVSQPAVSLGGCSVLPDPSPEHLYSFRIDMDGTQLATLEVDNHCFDTKWFDTLTSLNKINVTLLDLRNNQKSKMMRKTNISKWFTATYRKHLVCPHLEITFCWHQI